MDQIIGMRHAQHGAFITNKSEIYVHVILFVFIIVYVEFMEFA